MTEKNESLLALPEVEPDLGFGSKGSMVPLTDGHFITPDKQQIVYEAYRQRMAMVATRVKHDFGIEQIGMVDRHATAEFAKTAEFIMETKIQAKGKEHQKYVEEFAHRMVQEAAHHLLATTMSNATTMGDLMMQTPYPPEIGERPGFWKRVFG